MFEFLGFLVGVQLTMMLFAALYRILDLWYCFRHFWIGIITRILLVGGMIFLFYFLTGSRFQSGLLAGQIFFVIFHITIFWLGRLQIAYMRQKS